MNTIKLFRSYKLFFVAAVCSTVFFTSCSSSDTLTIKPAQLSGSNEAPPVTTTGSGTVDGTYNTKTKEITLNLKWSLGNSGDTTLMGHIHKGAVGVSGPVVVPLKGLPSGATDQQFTFTSEPLTAEQETDLKAGDYYVNIHSNSHPGGELRAQLVLQ